jgi:hypothetical protein
MMVARLKPNESSTKRAAARLDAASLGQTRKSQRLKPVSDMLVEVGETAASARRPAPSSSEKMGADSRLLRLSAGPTTATTLGSSRRAVAISTAPVAWAGGFASSKWRPLPSALSWSMASSTPRNTVCMFGRLRSAAMPMRIVPPSSARMQAVVASASVPASSAASRIDRSVGSARNRVCDLITPIGGWHFEDEVPDRWET